MLDGGIEVDVYGNGRYCFMIIFDLWMRRGFLVKICKRSFLGGEKSRWKDFRVGGNLVYRGLGGGFILDGN